MISYNKIVPPKHVFHNWDKHFVTYFTECNIRLFDTKHVNDYFKPLLISRGEIQVLQQHEDKEIQINKESRNN